MSLQSIIFAVCDEVGLNRPASPIMQQTDKQTLQLLALLRRAGTRDVLQEWDWSNLITSGSVTTVASQASYAMPTDFDRFVDETQWYTTTKVPLWGPMNQQDWARNEFGMVTVGPYFRQQLRGKNLYLQPTPTTAGQILNFYYVSNNWVYLAGNTSSLSSVLTNDTDTFRIPEDVLTAFLLFRWLRSKGLAYDEEKDDYEDLLAGAKATDRGARTLSMDPQQEVQGMQTGFIVPITGFGQ